MHKLFRPNWCRVTIWSNFSQLSSPFVYIGIITIYPIWPGDLSVCGITFPSLSIKSHLMVPLGILSVNGSLNSPTHITLTCIFTFTPLGLQKRIETLWNVVPHLFKNWPPLYRPMFINNPYNSIAPPTQSLKNWVTINDSVIYNANISLPTLNHLCYNMPLESSKCFQTTAYATMY